MAVTAVMTVMTEMAVIGVLGWDSEGLGEGKRRLWLGGSQERAEARSSGPRETEGFH